MKKFLKKVFRILKNKYVLILIIFFFWLLIFDKNNLIERAKELKKLQQLEKDKKYYLERIEKDSKQMNELKTNNENLEKFAREQYLMKKKNEDIFIIVEEEEK